MKQSNRFSFYNMKKEETDDTQLDLENLENLENAEEFPEDVIAYTFDDDKVVAEYFLNDGISSLYCNNGDNTFSRVFDSWSYGNDNYIYMIYKSDDIYIIEKENTQIINAFYMKKEDYKQFDSMQKNSKDGFSFTKYFALNRFLARHAVPLILNRKTIKEFASDYKTLKCLFMKYYMASKYIPASAIIDSTLEIANHYIATGELDNKLLISNWSQLGNFQDLCSASYDKISEFVFDPENTDLRELSEVLQRNLNNIYNLLDMYLQEELER